MAILKFRIYLAEDDSVYRDVVIKPAQTFLDLHYAILKAYEFDSKHEATFYRSNEHWQRGREISFVKYDKPYPAEPLLMGNTSIQSEIRDTNQRFVYIYDFAKKWTFDVELINIAKEQSNKIIYPATSRTEGIGPMQYGTRSLLGEKYADIELKFDLNKKIAGFGAEDEGKLSSDDEVEIDSNDEAPMVSGDDE